MSESLVFLYTSNGFMKKLLLSGVMIKFISAFFFGLTGAFSKSTCVQPHELCVQCITKDFFTEFFKFSI